MNKTSLIQSLIDKNGYSSYLEIGYGKGDNFDSINIKHKQAVDPNLPDEVPGFKGASDEYFNQLDGRTKFSLILIDGDHTAEQVERDIVNAYQRLRKGGVIVVHDVAPTSEEMTRIPRESKQWTGDVFRAWHGLVMASTGVSTDFTTDDYGMGLIYHTEGVKIEPGFISDITFEEYSAGYGA